jgi:hypothetical protein
MTATLTVKGFTVDLESQLQNQNGRLGFHQGAPAYGRVDQWIDGACPKGGNPGEYDPINSPVDRFLLEALVQRRMLKYCLKDADEPIRRMAQGIVLTMEELMKGIRTPLSDISDLWRFGSAVVRNVGATGLMGGSSQWHSGYAALFRGTVSDKDLLLFVNPCALSRHNAADLKDKKLLVKPTAKQWLTIGNAMALLTPPHLRSMWKALPQIGVQKRNGWEQPQIAIPSYTLAVMLEGCRLLPEFLHMLTTRLRAAFSHDYRTMYAERQKYAVWACAFDFKMQERMAAWDRMVYERIARQSRDQVSYYTAPMANPVSKLVPPWQGPTVVPLNAGFRS